jgi:hypothetical protein
MALANIAVLLAQKGLRVLAVDWDLEAPGLDRYFRSQFKTISHNDNAGLIDLLVDATDATSEQRPDWRDYVSSIDVAGKYPLSLITSGRPDGKYDTKVLDFDWRKFFEHANGGEFFEELREQWREEFNVVLIDSRTGITDSGGVCTIQLPDILALVFTTNDQSVEGVLKVASRAQVARQTLAYDRMPLLVFPLLSRFEGRTEFQEAQKWLDKLEQTLKPFYDDWVPKSIQLRRVLERTKLPYITFFSFGESLPVVSEGTSDPEGLGYAYLSAASLIAGDFQSVDRLIRFGPEFEVETSAVPELTDRTVEDLPTPIEDQSTEAVRRIREAKEIGAVSLDLSHLGSLRQLPRELQQLSALQMLDLSGCKQLRDLSPLADLTSLQALKLSALGQLQDVSLLAGLTALYTLDLSECKQLRDLSPLAGLASLQMLDLSGCEQLLDLSPVAGLTLLQTLYLDSCLGIREFSPIEILLSKLKVLSLFDCNFDDLPPEVCGENKRENVLSNIRAHYEDLKSGQRIDAEVKVLFLGNGGVGKTQLGCRLRHLPFDPTIPTTHGVQLSEISFELEGFESAVRLNLWNFGGQEVYHGSHALFLQGSAVFLKINRRSPGYAGEAPEV